MDSNEYRDLLIELESLPAGGITYKTINNKKYAYYQWRVNGKQYSKRVKDKELLELSEQISRRKYLQNITENVDYNAMVHITPVATYDFRCIVRTGNDLVNFIKPVSKWRRRECFKDLKNYIYGDDVDKVYILYGLRRTGKTTLIKQIILDMDDDLREKSAFIQMQEGKTLADVNQDLRYLETQGYKYIFIDEVTLLDDFIEGAALFSDVYAASGMKIVLSGTDSLGFMFTEDEELYDRCIMSHITFIPYREFDRVLGIKGIDEYIRYGGTMSISGKNYNDSIFANRDKTNEYIDSSIARNIQHSLKNYDYERHFRSLRELYERDELTNVINRVVEDINHRFTMEVLNRDFKSNDIRISASNLRKDRVNSNDVLDKIDIDDFNSRLKKLLEIKDKAERIVDITDAHRYEIKEYLDLLDLTVEVETRWMSDYNHVEKQTTFSQPGIRYSQAEALIVSLVKDETFRKLSLIERNRITERILNEVKGRMMEDIILLETELALNNRKSNSVSKAEVFKLKFKAGEYDMVIFNPDEGNCSIYEINHSTEVVLNQCKHLLDEEKCEQTEFRYGPITGRYVIYRGKTTSLEKEGIKATKDVTYLNVEEYLKGL